MAKLLLVSCLIINDKKELLLLYRKDHKHFETPGGKVKEGEELKTAAVREAKEELGDIELAPLKLFVSIDFKTPDGREAVANKFLTKITKGTPRIMELDLFERFEYIPIDKMNDYPLSPDLKKLSEKLKSARY